MEPPVGASCFAKPCCASWNRIPRCRTLLSGHAPLFACTRRTGRRELARVWLDPENPDRRRIAMLCGRDVDAQRGDRCYTAGILAAPWVTAIHAHVAVDAGERPGE